MNENSTISIKDLVLLFWNHLWILILSLVVGAGAAYAYTTLAVDPQYSSHISMYVQTYTGITNDQENAYNDISKSKQLINTYIQVLKDDAVMESVGKELCKKFDEKIISESFSMADGSIRPASLASCISITTVTDTSAITISATTKNAELSAAICNELCRQANHFTDKAIGVGEINSIDTAKVYPSPVSPNKVKNTAIGGLALMMLAALIIFLIDFFDNTVKDSEVLSVRYKKAILGEIDDIATSKSKKNSADHISLLNDDVPFNVVESYKAMRTNIGFAISTSDKKALVVSSANPGEGKSTTAANIAITMADEGQNVLLIDADMRKPVQHKIFSVKNDKGLSSVLSKMKNTEDCIQKTDVSNLNVLTSGPIPPNPSELLSSERTAKLLEKMSSEYDVIVIDSPPINVVSDTLNLSQSVAGLLTVVRCGYTAVDDIKELMVKTELAHMDMLGFVLTRLKRKNNGRYYKRYGKYHYYKNYSYGYGEQPQKIDEKAEKKEAVK
ncbi:MAG: polysaccharide biosynthesis tyrosine autokinase [Ruminococcus sp.]|nr:polysaccharide biosynthesis tyrosine autokinase [Ruminococcus sp.]